MKRILYLHIGAHRTATTSIQQYMKANFGKMQERGYFHPYGAGRHFELINRIFSGRTALDAAMADITARADSKPYPIHTVVISDEDICTRPDLTPLARLSAMFDVRVVFMLRRQDLWLESWYQQNVKWQWNPALAHLRFADFMALRHEFFWIDYDRMVQRLEAVFGAGRVICRVFEAGQMPQGPVADFCDAIGLQDREGFAPTPHANPAFSPLMCEFMRNLPLDRLPVPQRRRVEAACEQADAALHACQGPQSALYMPAAERAAVMAEYAPGNAALARRYFGRETLFTAPLPAADAPLAQQDLPVSSAQTLALLVGPVLQALLADLPDQQQG